jgi:hypothetical protein
MLSWVSDTLQEKHACGTTSICLCVCTLDCICILLYTSAVMLAVECGSLRCYKDKTVCVRVEFVYPSRHTTSVDRSRQKALPSQHPNSTGFEWTTVQQPRYHCDFLNLLWISFEGWLICGLFNVAYSTTHYTTAAEIKKQKCWDRRTLKDKTKNYQQFSFFRRVRKLRKVTTSFIMFVSLSDRVEQLGSHWTDFDETWYFSFFRKCVENIQVSLKSDKNNWYFTWRRFHIYDNISLNSS